MAIISSSLAGVFALAAVVAALISYFSRIQVDSREPPVVHPNVPFIGHLIGLVREGPLYYARVRAKTKAKIFTLPILGSRTYICASPSLTAAIQRASSSLDFDELVAQATPRMVGMDKKAASLFRDPNAKAEGRHRVIELAHSIVNPSLAPQRMEDVTAKQLNHFNNFLKGIDNGQEVQLYHLITRELAVASMDTFYGPNSPFNVHPELVEDFFTWENDVVMYMVSPLLVPKASEAFERMVKGWKDYFTDGHIQEAHSFLQQRRIAHSDAGFDNEGQARLDLALAFGFNSNAAITAFWLLNNIYSRPDLLAEIREEVRSGAVIAPGTISYAKLKENCPLIASVLRETMRTGAPMTSARWIQEDTIIADTYLLRKGSVVQAIGGLMHSDPEVWGPDVDSFNPRRFLGSQFGHKTTCENVQGKTPQVHAAAFRGFGGGASMCPGRYFAQMELVSLAAVIVSGWDLLPPEGQEQVGWNPAKDEKKFTLAVTKPIGDINVRFQKREGVEGLEWKVQV